MDFPAAIVLMKRAPALRRAGALRTFHLPEKKVDDFLNFIFGCENEEFAGEEKGDPRVVELQQLLKDNAYDPGEIDGNLSVYTIKAIDVFRLKTSLAKLDRYTFSQAEFKEMVNLLTERLVLVGHWRQDTGLVEIKLLHIGAQIRRMDDPYWGYRNWKLKPQGLFHWFSSGKDKQIWNYSIINQNEIELVINGHKNTWNRIR